MIIALVGQKGGAGKTTTAICVGSELLARDINTLIADADPQRTLLTWGVVANDAGQPTPTIVGVGKSMAQANQLPLVSTRYEITLIDCPPRLDEIQRAALTIADIAVIPCSQSGIEAWAASESASLIESARKVNPTLRAVVLLTRVMHNTTIGKGARESLESLGLPILKSELGFRIAYQEAPAAGMGAAQYAPMDPAATEVRALTDELLALTKKGAKRRA
jgi:ATPases involved in chromosome partitioning